MSAKGRHHVWTVIAAAILAACTGSASSPATHPGVDPAPVASARGAPVPFTPSADSLGGRVVRVLPNAVVLESAGREVEVSLRDVVEVWKETSVKATELEVGDIIFTNGTGGSPFVARYVWANIAQLDGEIQSIDDRGMDVKIYPHGQVQRVDFSSYIEFGTADGSRKVARQDLVAGREIGLVVYRPAAGPLRATRVW